MLPKVAIICANYNYGDYIVAAMESVAKQTYQGELSLYVVDDGSSDDSWEKISNYYESQKEKISSPTTPPWLYIKRIENSGASIARNTAIEMCWGWADIIGVLDSDDEYYPEKVERLVSKLVEHDEVGVAYADYDIQTPTHCKREFKNSFNRQTLMERCIVHSNSLIKTKYLRQVVLPNGEIFDSRLHGPASKGFFGCTEDYDLWIRLSKVCMISHVPECLAKANEHGNNQSLKMTQEIFQHHAQILGNR
jgi:glycosyltransferase involved in cell wall biosynthesis